MLDVNLKMLNVKMNENVLFFDIAAYLVNNGSSKGPLKAKRQPLTLVFLINMLDGINMLEGSFHKI